MRHLSGFAVLVGALLVVPALAQTPAEPADAGWQGYPAFTEVTAVTSGFGRVWAGTPGGVFGYDPATGEIERRSAIGGLRGGQVRALVTDERRGALWVGYADGALDRLPVDGGAVGTYLDIQRNTQFPGRTVRRMRVRGDSLYVATDFGVVVFDLVRNEVRNTYSRLSTLPPGTAVNDVLFTDLPDGRPGLWLATDAGIVRAALGDPALQSPAAWTLDSGSPDRALSLAVYAGADPVPAIYAGGGPVNAHDLYKRRPEGGWDRTLFINDDILDLVVDGPALLLLRSFSVRPIAPPNYDADFRAEGATALRGLTLGPGGRLWVGDAALGLFPLPDGPIPTSTVTFAPEPITPEGPFSNSYNDLDVAPDGTVWTVSTRVPAAQTSAISRLDPATGAWTSRLTRDEQEALGRADLLSIDTDRDGTVYVGTDGDGLIIIRPDGETVRYDETNSSLRQAGPILTNVVVSDVAFEGDVVWAANKGALVPLQRFAPDGTSVGLPVPNGASFGDNRYRLAIDRLGQKWFALGGAGLAVWDTGADPTSPSDDRVRQYRGQGTINGGGLPGADVSDVVVDGDGTVWIGTNRGVATVFSPGSAFSPDANLGLPQFTLTPSRPDGSRDPFLRDVVVNDLDVDPAGHVWVATTSGAYLAAPSPQGSGYVVLRELNSSTGPLPSDNVTRIAVRPRDGRVFLTTAEGLFSVSGDATQAATTSEALHVSPSPFRPAEAPQGVLVSGLATARSTVRVLTLAGELIYETEASGGSMRWDGKDGRTGALVSSGVYLIASVGTDGQAVLGKIAVIR